MDKLRSMAIFVHVVNHGSFRSASGHFDISATMVGKHIQYLESSLGSRLLNRTTRRQSLTESGRIYYHECQRILDDINNAENQIQTLENRPQGTVRVNSPVTYGNQILAPIVVDFLSQYPSINVDLILENRLIDPLHEQYDVIVRIGELADSSMIARQVGVYEMIYAASPDYLQQHSVIETVSDLRHHTCLGFNYDDAVTTSNPLQFNHSRTRLKSNNGQVLTHAAVQGIGLILQPKILIAQQLADGTLQPVLPQSLPEPSPINLLYKDKQLSLKNRTFVDFVLASLRK